MTIILSVCRVQCVLKLWVLFFLCSNVRHLYEAAGSSSRLIRNISYNIYFYEFSFEQYLNSNNNSSISLKVSVVGSKSISTSQSKPQVSNTDNVSYHKKSVYSSAINNDCEPCSAWLCFASLAVSLDAAIWNNRGICHEFLWHHLFVMRRSICDTPWNKS